LGNIGAVTDALGDFETALSYHQQGHQLAIQLDHKKYDKKKNKKKMK